VAPPALVSVYKARMIRGGGAQGCGAPRKTGRSLAWPPPSVYLALRMVVGHIPRIQFIRMWRA
jgi:hypothetical protein